MRLKSTLKTLCSVSLSYDKRRHSKGLTIEGECLRGQVLYRADLPRRPVGGEVGGQVGGVGGDQDYHPHPPE